MDTCSKFGLLHERSRQKNTAGLLVVNETNKNKQDTSQLSSSSSSSHQPLKECCLANLENLSNSLNKVKIATTISNERKLTEPIIDSLSHGRTSNNEIVEEEEFIDTLNPTEALKMSINNIQYNEDVCYHHFALLLNNQQLMNKLSDVLFVLVAGSANRVEAHANYLEQLPFFQLNKWTLERLTSTNGSRFDLYKVGPVLLANHGIGSASMSIALHEIFLMCRVSGRLNNITLIRFGTCGGIGVEPGTVCITNKVYDGLFRSHVEWPVCGKIVHRESVIDNWTANKLLELGLKLEQQTDHQQHEVHQMGGFKVCMGATLSTNDFYEEQGRTNGSISDHSIQDKMKFLVRAQQLGVINMEMEAHLLAAMCHKLNVKHGVACVALTNRMINDKITVPHDLISRDYEIRLFKLNAKFIEHLIVDGSQ